MSRWRFLVNREGNKKPINSLDFQAGAVALFAMGLSYDEVSEKIEVSHTSVERWVAKYGVDMQLRRECQFWSKTKEVESGCIEWQYGIGNHGYGIAYGYCPDHNGTVHRVAWWITNGPISEGICVLHKCDNRKCVNPNHLFLGTRDDNNVDMRSKHRHSFGESHCFAKLTEDNVRTARLLVSQGKRSINSFATEFGVSGCTMYEAVNGITWKEVK